MVSTSFTFVVNGSSPATDVVFTPPLDMKAPVPAGADLGLVHVTPADWSGMLTLSGTNANSFTITSLADGPHVFTTMALGEGSYAATITPTP